MTAAELYGIADDSAPATTTYPETTFDPPTATGPRFKQFNAFVDFDLAKLRRNELAVWLVLYRMTDAATNTARVSYATVAERAGCSTATVKRVVGALRERGLLRVVKQGGFNRGASSFRVTTGST